MAVRIAPVVRQQFFDNQGRVAAGMKVFTYAATTVNKLSSYTSSTGGVANANPIILDTAGRTPSGFWLTDGSLYKIVLAPANDSDPPVSPIWTEDNVSANDATLAALAGSTGSSFVGHIATGTGAVARTLQSKARESVSPEDFGAVGDGVTDDSTAFTNAAATGKSIRLTPGLTYYTGPFTLSTAGQGVLAWGATVKLKAASVLPLCKLNASGCWVEGGTWNANSVAQSGVLLNADYCAIRFATLQNCGAAGIYGSGNANYLTIAQNTVKDAVTYGIYVETLTADAYGNRIIDNLVDTSATAGASGIYFTGSNTPYTFKQYQWVIRGNRVKGSTSTPTGIGITARAVDGICTENHVYGYTIGISPDITSRSIISNNRVEGVAGATGYNIEVNGHHNVISRNYTKGGKYGIVCTSATFSLDHNVISGNSIENPTTNAIYYVPSGGMTGRYTSIVGNNIDMSDAGAGVQAIYLTGDCIHSHICENNVLGRGSATAGTRAVYLDTPAAAAFISIVNNKFAAFERAVGVYSSGALTVTDLTSDGNDVSSDVSQSTIFWNFESSAVVGTRVTHINSKNANGSYQDVHDMLLNVFTLRSTTYSNPEGLLTAGIGSIHHSLNSAGGSYRKNTGANTNTGWVAL